MYRRKGESTTGIKKKESLPTPVQTSKRKSTGEKGHSRVKDLLRRRRSIRIDDSVPEKYIKTEGGKKTLWTRQR